MVKMLSTRDLADALGVSESSLRRWANDGVIRVSKTAGGHRRIALHEAIRFVRQTHASVVRPEKLGLPEVAAAAGAGLDLNNLGVVGQASMTDVLFEALSKGDARGSIGLVMSLYLAGQPLASICDGPVRGAMARIGTLWEHNDAGVMIEHRATDICMRAVTQVRLTMPEPAAHAPTAVGGAPSGDPYILPSLMAAAVLADLGLQDVNLGPETPADSLGRSIQEHRASLAWIAFTAPQHPPAAERYLKTVARFARERLCTVVAGGRQAATLPAPLPEPVMTMNSFSELAAFARGLASTRTQRTETASA